MKSGPSWRRKPPTSTWRATSIGYASHTTLANRLRFSTARALLHSPVIRRQLSALTDIASYLDWQSSHFGDAHTLSSKAALWRVMSGRMQARGEPWHVLEFGVAFGHATKWWLAHHDESVIATWDGFDRFTGLPRAWRGDAAGTFDAHGKPPSIDDHRVAWHVGDLQQTIGDMDGGRIASGGRLAYFDLDLYEPSRAAWDWLLPHLRPGDLLYFDEAHDSDERRLLDESVLPVGDYARVGATLVNLALEVRSLNGVR
jgi:hypothetical protein